MPDPDLAKNNELRALVRAAVPHLVAQEARLHIDSIAARARQATDEADFLAIRAGHLRATQRLIAERFARTERLSRIVLAVTIAPPLVALLVSIAARAAQ